MLTRAVSSHHSSVEVSLSPLFPRGPGLVLWTAPKLKNIMYTSNIPYSLQKLALSRKTKNHNCENNLPCLQHLVNCLCFEHFMHSYIWVFTQYHHCFCATYVCIVAWYFPNAYIHILMHTSIHRTLVMPDLLSWLVWNLCTNEVCGLSMYLYEEPDGSSSQCLRYVTICSAYVTVDFCPG